MKVLLVIILTLVAFNLSGQQLDSCGLDNDSKVNKYEAGFLNVYFKDVRNTFEFSGKKIAFVTGSTGSTIGTKMEYFRDVKKRELGNSKVTTSLIILTAEENFKSSGYDAIITYWVKVLLSDKKRGKIISELKASH